MTKMGRMCNFNERHFSICALFLFHCVQEQLDLLACVNMWELANAQQCGKIERKVTRTQRVVANTTETHRYDKLVAQTRSWTKLRASTHVTEHAYGPGTSCAIYV